MAAPTAQTTPGPSATAAGKAGNKESKAADGDDDEWVSVELSELYERVGPSLRRIQQRSRSEPVPGASPGGPPRDIVLEAGRAYLGLIAGGCRFWGRVLEAGAEAFGAAMDPIGGRKSRSGPLPDTSAAGFEQLLRLMAEIKTAKQEWVFDRVADVLSPDRSETVPWQRRHRVKP